MPGRARGSAVVLIGAWYGLSSSDGRVDGENATGSAEKSFPRRGCGQSQLGVGGSRRLKCHQKREEEGRKDVNRQSRALSERRRWGWSGARGSTGQESSGSAPWPYQMSAPPTVHQNMFRDHYTVTLMKTCPVANMTRHCTLITLQLSQPSKFTRCLRTYDHLGLCFPQTGWKSTKSEWKR
jgi:hypothetical protein